MARPIPLPVVTNTRIDISPRQEIRIQDFLRGLKRPRSKAIAAPAAYCNLSLNATAAVDHNVSVSYEALPNGTFKEQEEAVTSPTPAGPYAGPMEEVMEAPTVVRTYTKKGFVPPPAEKLRDFSLLLSSQGPLEDHEHLAEELRDEAKSRLSSPDAQLILTPERRTSLSQAKSRGEPPVSFIEQRRAGTSTYDPDTVMKNKKRRTKTKGKKRRAPVNGLALVPSLPTDSTSSPAAKHNRRTNVTSSVRGVELHKEILDDIDPALLGELDDPLGKASLDVGRPQVPKEANVRKPVTRLRKAINMPQHKNIPHEGFKFLPATPKAVRAPGWKLGSGFEDIKLERTTRLKVIKAYPTKAQRAKHRRFQKPSIRSLELSTTISPSVQAKTSRTLSSGGPLHTTQTPFERSCQVRKHTVTINPWEYRADTLNSGPGGEAIFDNVRALASSMRAPFREAGPRQCANWSTTQTALIRPDRTSILEREESGNSQNIREPSKSEREGWLKRRRKVNFVIEADQGAQQHERSPPQGAYNSSVENIFDTHNAIWYGEGQETNQQTGPSQLPSSHATQAEHIAESYRSDQRRNVSYAGFEARSGEDGEMILDELVTDDTCQPVRRWRNLDQISPIHAPSRFNNPASLSRFQVADPSRTIPVQDPQGRRHPSHVAMTEVEAYFQGMIPEHSIEINADDVN